MLQSCISSFRRISLSIMWGTSKKHGSTLVRPSKNAGCPSIFSSTAICRKLSRLEEGKIDPESDGKKPDKPGFIERLKLGWRKYGVMGVTTYCVLYMATLSQVYFALHHDIFNAASIGMDPATVVTKVSHLFLNFYFLETALKFSFLKYR